MPIKIQLAMNCLRTSIYSVFVMLVLFSLTACCRGTSGVRHSNLIKEASFVIAKELKNSCRTKSRAVYSKPMVYSFWNIETYALKCIKAKHSSLNGNFHTVFKGPEVTLLVERDLRSGSALRMLSGPFRADTPVAIGVKLITFSLGGNVYAQEPTRLWKTRVGGDSHRVVWLQPLPKRHQILIGMLSKSQSKPHAILALWNYRELKAVVLETYIYRPVIRLSGSLVKPFPTPSGWCDFEKAHRNWVSATAEYDVACRVEKSEFKKICKINNEIGIRCMMRVEPLMQLRCGKKYYRRVLPVEYSIQFITSNSDSLLAVSVFEDVYVYRLLKYGIKILSTHKKVVYFNKDYFIRRPRLKFSPDASLLAIYGSGRLIRVLKRNVGAWQDLKDRSLARNYCSCPLISFPFIYDVAFSKDNKKLLYQNRQGEIVMYSTVLRKELMRITRANITGFIKILRNVNNKWHAVLNNKTFHFQLPTGTEAKPRSLGTETQPRPVRE